MDRRFDDMTLRAAAESFEDQLDEVLDVEAGLRDVLIEDEYHQLDNDLAEIIDVEAGLASVLDENDSASVEWSSECAWVTCDGVGRNTATFTFDGRIPKQADTLERVRRLAVKMLGTLSDVPLRRLGDGAAFAVKRALDQAERQAHAFGLLPAMLAARAVDRPEAVEIVHSTADAFMRLHSALNEMRAGKPGPFAHPVERVKSDVFDRAVAASRLQEPVARLFDPSDDVVDALL
ncbi:hypothetical protein AB0B10_15945 [Micromonospora arborensis]|uniref:hypothetical protein n=1 Tax=Micromonospora arborensis TaxID=2116518 RepID=UPI0033FFF038